MAGGRVGLFFNERKGEVGATLVKDQTPGREQQLAGVDVTYKFGETTELRAEYAETESASQAGDLSGSAYKLEFEHQSGERDVAARLREQEAGFGVGQQSGAGVGTQQAGVDARYRLSEETSVVASVQRDEDTTTGRTRDVFQTSVVHGLEGDSLAVGVVSSLEDGGGLPDAESHLAQVTTRRNFLDGRLAARATIDAPLIPGTTKRLIRPVCPLVATTIFPSGSGCARSRSSVSAKRRTPRQPG